MLLVFPGTLNQIPLHPLSPPSLHHNRLLLNLFSSPQRKLTRKQPSHLNLLSSKLPNPTTMASNPILILSSQSQCKMSLSSKKRPATSPCPLR